MNNAIPVKNPLLSEPMTGGKLNISYPLQGFSAASSGWRNPLICGYNVNAINQLIKYGTLALLIVGTGGAVTSIEHANSTGGQAISQGRLNFRRSERRKVLRARDQLLSIKNNLGLTLSDVAAILLVGRPAIYEWLNGIEPRIRNQMRISQLFYISQYWIELSKFKLAGNIHLQFDDGHSLFEKLTSEYLDNNAVKEDLESLANKVNLVNKTKRERSIAKKMKEAGFKPVPVEVAAANKQQISPSWIDEE